MYPALEPLGERPGLKGMIRKNSVQQSGNDCLAFLSVQAVQVLQPPLWRKRIWAKEQWRIYLKQDMPVSYILDRWKGEANG